MRSALGGRNQVDVAFGNRVFPIQQPHESPFDCLALGLEIAAERFLGQPFALLELIDQVLSQSTGIKPFLFLAGRLDLELDLEPWAQHGLRAQHMLESGNREFLGIEELRIRPEAHRGASILLPHLAHHFELRFGPALLEADVVFLAAAPHPALEVLRQCVYDRDANAVQAAGEFVILVGEFPTRVQSREDQLDPGSLFLGVDVDRHSATVVLDFE